MVYCFAILTIGLKIPHEIVPDVILHVFSHITVIDFRDLLWRQLICKGVFGHGAQFFDNKFSLRSDIIYAMTAEEHAAMVERMETRHGLRQLSYMKELGMGNNRYKLIDLDNGGKEITAAEAAKDLKPFVQ